MLYIASDHAGFKRKEVLKKYLTRKHIVFADLGPARMNPKDDYPDVAEVLARRVARTKGRGVLLCGNAEGVCIVANKIDGVRAAVGYSAYAARTARSDDNTNIVCIPGRTLTDRDAKKILDTWLKTPFSGASRHKRRLKKIKKIEKKN